MSPILSKCGRGLAPYLTWIKRQRSNIGGINRYSSASTALNLNTDDGSTLMDDPKLWVKSPYPDVSPVLGVTMSEFIFSQLGKGENREQKIAFECAVSGRKYTYSDMYRLSRAFGASLLAAGLRKGDRVAIVMPNIPEYPLVMLGAWEIGLSISPVNPAYTAAEIKRQLENSDVSCIVTIPAFVPVIRDAAAQSPALALKTKPIVVGGAADIPDDCHNFFEMLRTSTAGVQFATAKDVDVLNDIALLPYSSGTTGNPKGVMLTHASLISCINQFNVPDVCATFPYEGPNEQERFLGLLPFFHAYGFSAIMCFGVYQGAYTLSLPKFEPKMFVDALRRHKPTALHLVPPLIQFLAASPDVRQEDLANVHTIVGAAAPIGVGLINRLLDKAGKYIFFQEGYGMTELSPVSHIGNPSTRNTKKGSCGTPVPNTWTKLIDTETGRTLGRNERGELLVKGPQVMKGYYKNDEATRSTIDSDGWLHTGDVAIYDDEGFCYIVDRLKELIKVKGFQVAPSELEDELRSHPGVADVAVIGVPNEEWGELPRAYIVPRPKVALTEGAVNGYLADKVASYKQLRGGIEFVEAIPKAPSGKILRRQLMLSYREKMGLPL